MFGKAGHAGVDATARLLSRFTVEDATPQNPLVNELFLKIARAMLAPFGVVCLHADHQDYFEQLLLVFLPWERNFVKSKPRLNRQNC